MLLDRYAANSSHKSWNFWRCVQVHSGKTVQDSQPHTKFATKIFTADSHWLQMMDDRCRFETYQPRSQAELSCLRIPGRTKDWSQSYRIKSKTKTLSQAILITFTRMRPRHIQQATRNRGLHKNTLLRKAFMRLKLSISCVRYTPIIEEENNQASSWIYLR